VLVRQPYLCNEILKFAAVTVSSNLSCYLQALCRYVLGQGGAQQFSPLFMTSSAPNRKYFIAHVLTEQQDLVAFCLTCPYMQLDLTLLSVLLFRPIADTFCIYTICSVNRSVLGQQVH